MKTKEMTKEVIEETNVKNETVNQWFVRLPPEQQQFAFELWKMIHRAKRNRRVQNIVPARDPRACDQRAERLPVERLVITQKSHCRTAEPFCVHGRAAVLLSRKDKRE